MTSGRHMNRSSTRGPRLGRSTAIGIALAASLVAACGSSDDDSGPTPTQPVGTANVRPAFVGTVTTTAYDGNTDDLLTAGLGWNGLQSAAPTFATPTAPTAAELRRNAIYNNYRALVDMTTNGGYGFCSGPTCRSKAARRTPRRAPGKIAGTEYRCLQHRCCDRQGRGDVDGADPIHVQPDRSRAS